MPVEQLSRPQIDTRSTETILDRTLSVWDPRSECRFVVARPSDEPALWEEYLEGAVTGYRKYGAEKALEYRRIQDGDTTAAFFVAIEPNGSVAAGVRIQGPYLSAGQAHAITEWGTHPGAPAVRRMIEDRLPFGVVEAKGAWVADGAARRGELVGALGSIRHLLDGSARRPVHARDRGSPRPGNMEVLRRGGGRPYCSRALPG